jgi:aryl-alcohol dehydrogenase
LNVSEGSSIVIFGCGAVGLSAVMAARLSKVKTIIAVDLLPERRALAMELGATHEIDGRADIAAEVAAICPTGVAFALDTTANATVIETSFNLLAAKGTLGLLGVCGPEDMLSFNEVMFVAAGRTVKGILEGDSNPQIFIPQLIGYYQEGRFPFDRLIEYFDFDDINAAFAAADSGKAVKPVLRMPA